MTSIATRMPNDPNILVMTVTSRIRKRWLPLAWLIFVFFGFIPEWILFRLVKIELVRKDDNDEGFDPSGSPDSGPSGDSEQTIRYREQGWTTNPAAKQLSDIQESVTEGIGPRDRNASETGNPFSGMRHRNRQLRAFRAHAERHMPLIDVRYSCPNPPIDVSTLKFLQPGDLLPRVREETGDDRSMSGLSALATPALIVLAADDGRQGLVNVGFLILIAIVLTAWWWHPYRYKGMKFKDQQRSRRPGPFERF